MIVSFAEAVPVLPCSVPDIFQNALAERYCRCRHGGAVVLLRALARPKALFSDR